MTGHGFVWVCTDCERFAGPMPPPRDQLCDVRLLAEVDRLTAERAEARDNAEAAEELAREADAERKAVEADLSALRIEHEAQRAVIDGLRATGSMLIRERDELRAALNELRGAADEYLSAEPDMPTYSDTVDRIEQAINEADAALAGGKS